ncbi:fungal-specific transcription factor domain-containing protein [Aspergillus pseudoustus]|uniref:Fungal-specific transcription factor domain-containing protein n=1 Tax=Aspergillus pseudoustus TaxID=1810923 RepID=A0ABR4KC01_9EURO
MTTNGESNYAGCWTCRLRRKKCDKVRPRCGSCSLLDIRCYSDLNKPEWMETGTKQREMAQKIKAEVKRSAARRRSKKLMHRIARDLDGEGEDVQASDTGSSTEPARETDGNNSNNEEGTWRPESSNTSARSNFPAGLDAPRVGLDGSADSSPQVPLEFSTTPEAHRLAQRFDNELELSFVMIYLDYAFPVLFPFYTPTIFDGGRSWLLVLPMKIKALYHTTLSLTSHFFSNVPISTGPAYEACIRIACGEQRKQIDLAVKMVQYDLQNINSRGVHYDLVESAYLLDSIVQLLIFESIVATSETWRMHLDAGIVLFEQIVKPPGTMSSLLDLMEKRSSLPMVSSHNTLWNSDQASFRFFSAVLLLADVVSSTALEQPPRLRDYHDDLLTKPYQRQEPPLQLEDFFGCQSWIIRRIGEIAALDSWKKDTKKNRSLTIVQLVKRASTIEQEIEDGLARLNSNTDWSPHKQQPDLPKVLNPAFAHQNACAQETIKLTTRIWSYAARMYLHVTQSGWQTSVPAIRDDINRMLDLFALLPSPSLLRALAWPLCVAGCLAEEEQEATFRGLIRSMGPIGTLGTMKETLQIMENVWQKRAHVDPDTWDIAACLRSSGHMVMLI